MLPQNAYSGAYSMIRPPSPAQKKFTAGVMYTAGAFLLWGFVPPYWRLINHVPGLQIPAHRILWTCILLAVLISFRRGWGEVREALVNRKSALTLVLTAVLISVNWTVFIWAVVSNHLVESSMGYFINPLVNVALGVLLLRERLTFWQAVSVGFALAGVAFLAVSYRVLPWISLTLAFTFGFYGLLRKTVAVDSVTGTFIETLYLLPITLLYLGRETVLGRGAFGSADALTHLLLVLAGPVTALPLVWFASGARLIPLSMVGFIQYLAPTLHLALGVLLYHEAFTRTHLISFSLIWLGILIYLVSSFLAARKVRSA
jgi:chloramphenicol-sensitive protein RarD